MKKLITSVIAFIMAVSMVSCAGAKDSSPAPAPAETSAAPAAMPAETSAASTTVPAIVSVPGYGKDDIGYIYEQPIKIPLSDITSGSDTQEEIPEEAKEGEKVDTEEKGILSKLKEKVDIILSKGTEQFKNRALQLIKNLEINAAYTAIQEEIEIFSQEIDRKAAELFSSVKEKFPRIYKIGASFGKIAKEFKLKKVRKWVDEQFAEKGYVFH